MYNVKTPPESELPSSRALLRSTAIAAVVAAVLLVTAVLPAEYGVDPTGIGRVLGLKEMGEIKMALAREAAAEAAVSAVGTRAAAEATPLAASAVAVRQDTAATGAPATNSHDVTITLRPNEGKEIKLAMRKGARVRYSWTAAGGVVNYDTHADRAEAPVIKYHGYAKGQGRVSDEGELVAAFDGMHGWFWRNRTRGDVVVTLRTEGDYQELKRLD
jgi:hypothetical protein